LALSLRCKGPRASDGSWLVGDWGLAEAREKAAECRKLHLAGIDPIEHRKAAQAQAALEPFTAGALHGCPERFLRFGSETGRRV
jgi:Arm DNA-binding domain